MHMVYIFVPLFIIVENASFHAVALDPILLDDFKVNCFFDLHKYHVVNVSSASEWK